jgi:hypothetical protein
MEREIRAASTIRPFRTRNWAHEVPPEPGVYVVWNARSRVPAYVGETTSLRHRMSDLGRMVNHTFRRWVAAQLNVDGRDVASLSAVMSRKYVLSFIEVQLGRAELEDYLRLRWRDTIANKPAKRLLRGTRYRWVVAAAPEAMERPPQTMRAMRTPRDSL